MSLVRGQLKKGFYIRKKKEKVYVSSVNKGKLVYGGKQGQGAIKFRDQESAYSFLTENKLEKVHKVIEVR